MQSIVRALGSEHPCIHDPLNASQCWCLHLDGQEWLQPGENLLDPQPTNVYNYYDYFENDCFVLIKIKF